MKNTTNIQEMDKQLSDLRENRIREQQSNGDYDFTDDGQIEICEDCGTPINSHGHCPTCDY